EVYSIHTPGVSILVAPAYALALRLGVSPRAAVCVFMNLLAAFLAVNVWLFCRDIQGQTSTIHYNPDRAAAPFWPALLSTAAVMLTPPVVFYANLVYPELPAALFILYAFRHAFPRAVSFDPGSPNRGTGEPGNRRTDDIRTDDNDTLESPTRPLAHSPSQLLSSLCIAALPWLSFRFFLPAFVLAALLVQRGRAARSTRRWFALSLALPLLASLALFFAYQYRAFGSLNPAAGYLAQDYGERGMTSRGTLDGLFGILLDRGHGILTWSPVYLLALTGLFLLFRERRPLGIWLSVLLLAVYLPGAQFIFWWGGFAPPPRYMVVPAPLLGGALCYALARKPRPLFIAFFAPLLAASLLFGWLGCAHPGLLYKHHHLVTRYLPGFPIRLFPSFVKKGTLTWPLALLWGTGIILLNLWFSARWNRAGMVTRHSPAAQNEPLP
ncbi:MAG: hypothetical protein WCP22_12360, partial [Chlamydiota bacterium]